MNWDESVFDAANLPEPVLPPTPVKRRPTKRKRPEPGHVYIIQEPQGAYKIGRSAHVDQRLETVAAGLPQGRITVILTIPCTNPPALERSLHIRFRHQRLSGEWFQLSAQDLAKLKAEYVQD